MENIEAGSQTAELLNVQSISMLMKAVYMGFGEVFRHAPQGQ
jgi:hypothetical protein